MVARRVGGRWCGALLRGPSGAGKSSLTLACLKAGFRLVADDRVVVWRSGETLFGRAPEMLHGLMEVRGVGVVTGPIPLAYAPIVLVVDLTEAAERLPEPARETLAGVTLPRLGLMATAPHAALRLAAALAAPQHGL